MSEIYNCYEILDVKNPVELNANSSAWAKEILKEVGWQEGEKIPGNLNKYFGEVLKLKGLPSRPESLRELINDPDVKLTLTSAIAKVSSENNIDVAAERSVEETFKDTDLSNPVMAQVRATAIQAAKARMANDTRFMPEEEDFSDLDEEERESKEEEVNKESKYSACPCCHWDLSKDYIPIDIDENETRDFLISVLGGPAFEKEYKLFNGLCTVKFHMLTKQDGMLFDEQYAKDYVSGKLDVAIVAQRVYDRYQLALGLSEIKFASSLKKTSPIVPDIMSDSFAPTKEHTRLDRYITEFYDKVITSNELQNALNEKWREFTLHTLRLRQELHNEDFWTGVTLD